MKQILIVSSSASFIERNETLLRRSDFIILDAVSGAEALQILNNNTVDLLLIDMQLEDMTGDSLCSLLRNGKSVQLPLLLVCHDNADDIERLRTSGADALLARPVMPLQLIKTVGEFLTVQLIRSRRVSLRVKVSSKKSPAEFFCISHNISITGMMLETDISLEVGSIIDCQFTIPGYLPIATEGEIVRSARALDGSHQYGIRFTYLTRTCRQEIDRYIATMIRGEA